MDMYKKKSFQFLGTEAAREARINVRKSVREQSRYERFSLLRDMLSVLESPEVPVKERIEPSEFQTEVPKKPPEVETEVFKKPISCAPVTESSKPASCKSHKQISGIPKPASASNCRLDMLKKWREEKLLKKQLEMRSMKSAFKVKGVTALPMKAPLNTRRQESLTQSRLQVSQLQKPNSKVPFQVQKPQLNKDLVGIKPQSKVVNSTAPFLKPSIKATNLVSATTKPQIKSNSSSSAFPVTKVQSKVINSTVPSSKPSIKTTNLVSAPIKPQIKSNSSSALPVTKYQSKNIAQGASTSVQNPQKTAPSKNLSSQSKNLSSQSKNLSSQSKNLSSQSKNLSSQSKNLPTLNKILPSQSKNTNSASLAATKSQFKAPASIAPKAFPVKNPVLRPPERTIARGVPKFSSMKIPNKSTEQKVSTNDNRNSQSKTSSKPQTAVPSKSNIKVDAKVPIIRQKQGSVKPPASKFVGKSIQKTDTGQSLASNIDSSLESHSQSIVGNESKSFAPKDFVFKPHLFNSSIGEIDFLAVLQRVEAGQRNRTSTPRMNRSCAQHDENESEKIDSESNCANVKLETLESTPPPRSIEIQSTPSKQSSTSEMDFLSVADTPSNLKSVVPAPLNIILTECTPDFSNPSVVIETSDLLSLEHTDSSIKTKISNFDTINPVQDEIQSNVPELSPSDVLELPVETNANAIAESSGFLVKDEIKAIKINCQTSEKYKASDNPEEIVYAATKILKTPKTQAGQENFSRPVTRSVTRKSLATLNSGGIVQQIVAEAPIGPTPVKPRLRNMAEGFTPRRSLRLMRKSIHKSLEMLDDEQEPSFLDSPENVAPQKVANSCLAQDFSRMKLVSLADDIDVSVNVRKPKVSLLYTPPRTRKSIRQSVRGDLMCFSPGI